MSRVQIAANFDSTEEFDVATLIAASNRSGDRSELSADVVKEVVAFGGIIGGQWANGLRLELVLEIHIRNDVDSCFGVSHPTGSENQSRRNQHHDERQNADRFQEGGQFVIGQVFVDKFNVRRTQLGHVGSQLFFVVLLVVGFHHQEEFVVGNSFESWHTVQRIGQTRQLVKDQHPEHGSKRTGQNDYFKSNRNVGGQAEHRLATDLEFVTTPLGQQFSRTVGVPLHAESDGQAGKPNRQNDEWQNRTRDTDRFLDPVDRKRCVSIHLLDPAVSHVFTSVQQRMWIIELREDANQFLLLDVVDFVTHLIFV